MVFFNPFVQRIFMVLQWKKCVCEVLFCFVFPKMHFCINSPLQICYGLVIIYACACFWFIDPYSSGLLIGTRTTAWLLQWHKNNPKRYVLNDRKQAKTKRNKRELCVWVFKMHGISSTYCIQYLNIPIGLFYSNTFSWVPIVHTFDLSRNASVAILKPYL